DAPRPAMIAVVSADGPPARDEL
ncbi:MAG: hypothetical protein QOE31_2433, partial [Solirubrobacteraceae bacterium]|nr:hypothetical protein [Solirubrobacteraceae bacterium]